MGGGMLRVGKDLVEFCLQGRILDGGWFTQYYCRETIDHSFRGYSLIRVAAVTHSASKCAVLKPLVD